MSEILWRWREFLEPKTFMGLTQPLTVEQAIKAGRWSASRVYEVSIDGGTTWHSAPPDMPVIDIEGNDIPADRRRTGKPSDAAREAMDLLLAAAEKANAPAPAPEPAGGSVYTPGRMPGGRRRG